MLIFNPTAKEFPFIYIEFRFTPFSLGTMKENYEAIFFFSTACSFAKERWPIRFYPKVNHPIVLLTMLIIAGLNVHDTAFKT
jgi:hypothetical protein